MTDPIQTLNAIPLAGLMLVVAAGFLLGRLGWRGMSLGPAGGTMGVAILLGAAGLSFQQLYSTSDPRITVGAFGFALFIARRHPSAPPPPTPSPACWQPWLARS